MVSLGVVILELVQNVSLIALVTCLPAGIVGAAARLVDRLKRRRGAAA